MTELSDGEISRQRRLLSFFAFDSNANVCCLYHTHIISSVANSGSSLLRVRFNQLDDLGLLCGRASAANDSWSVLRDLDEVVFEVV